MAYNYAGFVTALSTETNIAETNAEFQAILPTVIDEAEQRIYRDLDLIATIVRDASTTATPSMRSFTLPQAQGRFVVVQSINIINGIVRQPLTKVSREVMDLLWPADNADSVTSMPMKYAPLTDQVVLLGPPPGAEFTVEVIGTIRPTPLSVSNNETYLSLYLPDLLFSAAMSAMSAYMRNWSAQADDPKMGMNWELDYNNRLGSANKEETQRKFQAFASTGGR